MKRKATREIRMGDLIIGGGAPITIQSMTNTKTADIQSTVNQIIRLEEAGCNIVRVTVPDKDSAEAIKEIVKHSNIPVVADIHFDYTLALKAIENGVDGLRINPGNIGNEDRVRQIVHAAKERNIKIRIGVNAGSLSKEILSKYRNSPEAMVESAFEHIRILEKQDFYNTVISLKSSSIHKTIEAYERFSEISDYPLHIGITEAGTIQAGTIKSSVGIGYLLLRGIGDTIRVSLTADPVEEVIVAKEILKSLDLLENEIKIISCPTCGRTDINLIDLAQKVEKATQGIKKSLTVAIMGCAVNGPGEAKEADIGIAGGKGEALLFKKGKIIKKIQESDIIPVLLHEIEKFEE